MTANSTIADRIASAIMDTIEREKRINRDDVARTVEVTMLADQAERARKVQPEGGHPQMSAIEVVNRQREWERAFAAELAHVRRDQVAFDERAKAEAAQRAMMRPSNEWAVYLSGEMERQQRAHAAMVAAAAKAAQEVMERQVYPTVFLGMDTAAPGEDKTVTWVDAAVPKADLPRTPAAIKADIKSRWRMDGE